MINTLKSMRKEINEMDCELSCKKQAVLKKIIELKKELEKPDKHDCSLLWKANRKTKRRIYTTFLIVDGNTYVKVKALIGEQ